jgi:hypothetical protein
MKKSQIAMVCGFLVVGLFLLFPSISRADMNVYDANGKYVGLGSYGELGTLYMGNHYHIKVVRIFIPSLSRFIFIDMETGGIASNLGGTWISHPFFETSDCTGKKYFSVLSEPYRHEILINGRTFLWDGTTSEKHIGSWISYRSTCETTDFNAVVTELTEVTLPFTVPIALPVRFKK